MNAKTLAEVQGIIANVSFMDRVFRVSERMGGFVLQIEYMEKDIVTGKLEKQRARKWYVSPYSTETEIVETAFKAARTSMDHVLKENFKYEGKRIYSPHLNVRARMMLVEMKDFDGRDHATSLEVIPTDGDTRFQVVLGAKQAGFVEQTPEGFIGDYNGRLSEALPSKNLAARWVGSEALKERTRLDLFVCGVKCKAGGRPEDDGHKFTVEFESEDGLSSGYECETCGMDNISFSMRNGP